MLHSHRPTDAALMEEARRVLDDRIKRYGRPGDSLRLPPHEVGGSARQADSCRADYEARRGRALQTCHRPSLYERSRFAPPEDSGAYVPELAARIDDDRNLTDGARRCGRKIAEIAYRQNREGRCLDITVSYLMKALGKCRRTVQNYLRQLEREGYIEAQVLRGSRSRMCIGLVVHLLKPLFARHHKDGWPEKRGNPGAQKDSQKYRFPDQNRKNPVTVSRQLWALMCMDGVFRSFKATLPPFPALSASVS